MVSRQVVSMAMVLVMTLGLTTAVTDAQQVAPPEGTLLYAQMTIAMQQGGSVHFDERTVILPAGSQQTIRENLSASVDISSQQHVLHARYTQTYTALNSRRVVLTSHTNIVAVAARVAQRNSDAPWWCQTLSSQDQAQVYGLTSLLFLPATPHLLGSVTPASVGGVPVWRLTIDLGNRTEDLAIAQDDHRLLQIVEVRGTATSANGIIKTVTDFSRYGEAVSAQLPQVCR